MAFTLTGSSILVAFAFALIVYGVFKLLDALVSALGGGTTLLIVVAVIALVVGVLILANG